MQQNDIKFLTNFQVEKKVPNFCIDLDTTAAIPFHQQKSINNKFPNIVKSCGSLYGMQLDPTFECTAQVAWMSESMKVGNHFNEFWWLIRKCHYLLHYLMNHCIHMVFSHYISNVINEYTIHFDNYYCKNVEFGHRKEVCFWLRPNLWPTTVRQ